MKRYGENQSLASAALGIIASGLLFLIGGVLLIAGVFGDDLEVLGGVAILLGLADFAIGTHLRRRGERA